MNHYLLKRLLLLPITLFAIILVNFLILNLAPNEPSTLTQKSLSGEANRTASSTDDQSQQYLQFREHFGLTLPILLNFWPYTEAKKIKESLTLLAHKKESMSVEKYHKLRSHMGDKARFIMPLLLTLSEDRSLSLEMRKEALNLFIRGGTKQGIVKAKLTIEEKEENRRIAEDNFFLETKRLTDENPLADLEERGSSLKEWLTSHLKEYTFTPQEKTTLLFLETRFARYLSRVATLDFGHIRNDRNKSVISEVIKRLKYSLTLAVLPMFFTFVLCFIFGMIMALHQNRPLDLGLNLLFLLLFAIPIFVAAPFLIEKIALHHTIPFTNIALPYNGFNSSQEIYNSLTSFERLKDIALHIFLPLIAIVYGSLAIQTRLARTAFLEVMRQDFVRLAKAKGIKKIDILIKHIGRAASITIITSLAASLGIILGGSLIVETVFEINGFGRFFYEAIIQRDYNVVLFSAFAGSFLTLIGYLLADISYTILDPRVTLD